MAGESSASAQGKKQMETDVRLQTIEERQKLRDEHIDNKFKAMGDDIAGVDRRLTNQIQGMESKLDQGFDRVFREISKERQRDEEREEHKKNEPATVRVTLLLGIIGISIPVIGLASGAIMLVVNPLVEKVSGNGGLSDQVQEVRTTSSQQVSEVRASSSKQVADLRSEMKSDVAAVRSEIKAHDQKEERDIADLRSELRRVQDASLANATRGEERYNTQQDWNKEVKEWNRRIIDRQLEFYEEFETVRREMATKATVKDMQASTDAMEKLVAATREEAATMLADLKYVQMLQSQLSAEFSITSKAADRHESQIAQISGELDKRWPAIIEATEKLGKLDPVIDDIGLKTAEANAQRIMMLERLIDAIDKSGSRGTNLRLPSPFLEDDFSRENKSE